MVIIKCDSCSTIRLRGNIRRGLGQEDGVLIEDPQGFIYHMTSVSLSFSLIYPPSLFCLSASRPHSVISHSPVGAGSKSAQLDHRHQSQPALRMCHLWAHREAFPLHSKWETNVAGKNRHSIEGGGQAGDEGGGAWGKIGRGQKW